MILKLKLMNNAQMKCLILIHFVFIFTFAFFLNSIAHAKVKVTIDPGHGGVDTGAVHGKAKESDIALKVAKILKELLDADPDFTADLTRTNDKTLSLQDRIEFAEKNKADMLISIHANASKDRRAQGIEIYFQNHLPPDEEMLYLAATENTIQKNQNAESEASEPTKKNDVFSIIEDLKRQYRIVNSHKLSVTILQNLEKNKVGSNAIRQAPFYMVSKAAIPSALVELGFLTNQKDNQRLIDPAYQREIAEKIYSGLRSYSRKSNKNDLELANLE